MASHGIQEIEGAPRRAFRCQACSRVFVPGVEKRTPSEALKDAVASVREETDAPFRLIASALVRHLGIEVSHTTIRSWSTDREPGELEDGSDAACERLSILWALHHEIQDEIEPSRKP